MKVIDKSKVLTIQTVALTGSELDKWEYHEIRVKSAITENPDLDNKIRWSKEWKDGNFNYRATYFTSSFNIAPD